MDCLIWYFVLSHFTIIITGNTSGVDFQAQLTHFLESVVSSQYSRPDTAFETVIFLEDNLQFLQEKTDLLSQYLPNILKVQFVTFHV